MKRIKKYLIAVVATIVAGLGPLSQIAFADMEFGVSPMTQKIVLTPGESYRGTFGIVNPVYNTKTFYYKLSVEPFYVDEDNNPIFENNGDYNQIVDWVSLDNETGSVEPNNTNYVNFTIHTPSDAPAGGQYAIIRVASDYDAMEVEEGGKNAVSIQNIMTIAHEIFAEVAGETERQGKIIDVNMPSFLLSGNITGASQVKNTGNVHGDAKYTLQVFPLFSDEEVYTNEENPETHTILPDRTLYAETSWVETPTIGIFNVIYTVEFEGSTAQVKKMVIKCPIWLLFIIIFAITAIILWLIMKARSRKSSKSRKTSTE